MTTAGATMRIEATRDRGAAGAGRCARAAGAEAGNGGDPAPAPRGSADCGETGRGGRRVPRRQVRSAGTAAAAPAAHTAALVPPGHIRAACPIGTLHTESGAALTGAHMAYESWGTLNGAGTNAVLIEHALTGDSHVCGPAGPGQPTAGWWEGIVGPGCAIDTNRFFVLVPAVLGASNRSTNPSCPGPDGRPWGARFPQLSVRDQVEAERRLARLLGITRFRAVVGPSAGGLRALEWACTHPTAVGALVLIATAARTTADQAAWAHTQLRALELDPAFRDGDYYGRPEQPDAGLALARQIAHTTYRSAYELNTRFGHLPQGGENPLVGGRLAVQSYLDHHGDKLVARFDAGAYRVATRAMLTHDVGRDRAGVRKALAAFRGRALVIGVDSDRLFPAAQCRHLAALLPRGRYAEVTSPCGHDGFLIERDQVEALLRPFLARC